MTGKNALRLLTVLATVFIFGATERLHALEYGQWTDDVKAARTLAQKNNRPLLMVPSAGADCAHCLTLQNNALSKPEFLRFAKNNRLVLLHTTASIFCTKLTSSYKKLCGGLSTSPKFFIFKVPSTANLELTTYAAFTSENEAILPEVTWDTLDSIKYCGRSWGDTIFDVNVGKESAWNATTATKVIKNCFPNTEFNITLSLTGSDTDNTGDNPSTPTQDEPTPADPETDTPSQPDTDTPSQPETDTPSQPGTSSEDTSDLPTSYVDVDKWAGIWLSDPAKAKYYAYINNRPLLFLPSAGADCAHCLTLQNNALSKPEFLKFAKENKIVLLHTTASIFCTKLTSEWKSKCVTLGESPKFFLFKVLKTAEFQNTTYKAFTNEGQVDLAQVTWDTTDPVKYCGRSWGGTILDVSLGKESSWNAAGAISLLKNCFPNNYWNTITPAASPADSGGSGSGEDDPDNPPSHEDDPSQPGSDVDPVNPSRPSGPMIDEDKWAGKWLTEPSKAKYYAYINDRPLLFLPSAGEDCAHCLTLQNNALNKPEFLKFAKENKIVLLHTTASIFCTKLTSAWKSKCETLGESPKFFLFKVLKTAEFTDDTYKAFTNAGQVDLVQVTWDTMDPVKYCGRSWGGTILDVNLGKETSWNAAGAISLLKNCFPNNYWNSILPPPVGPTGYEDAIQLGTIPWESALPEVGGSGIVTSETLTMGNEKSEQWLSFKGNQGRRYWCYANFSDAAGDYAYTVDVYATQDGIPTEKPFQTFTFGNAEALNKGFWFDTPSGSGTGLLYYVRLTLKTANKLVTDRFTFCIHQTVSAPAAGDVTNPLWSGSRQGWWTVDIDSAMASAFAANKPVLVYFAGLGWCPYCCGVELNILGQNEFKNAVKGYFNVLMDFRRRDDTGPSLMLMEDYLKANGLTESDGLAQLVANRAVQESIPTAGLVKPGWEAGAIGYPTFVYCRVVRSGVRAGGYELQPVGRFGQSVGRGAEAAEQLSRLDRLFSYGYCESYETIDGRDHTSLPLVDGNPAQVFAGQGVKAQWIKFAVKDGLSWNFSVQSIMASADAEVTLSVYGADGTMLYKTTSGSLKNGCNLVFIPQTVSSVAEDYWLKVEVTGQSDLVTGMLSYSQMRLVGEISLVATEIATDRTQTSVVVPLQRKMFQDGEEPVRFSYTVRAEDETGDYGNWIECGTYETEWPEDGMISLPLDIPEELADWSGSRNFIVSLETVEDGGCSIGDKSSARVMICAKPAFLPAPSATYFTLPQGVPVSIEFMVCAPQGAKATLLGSLPKGVLMEDHSAEEERPRVVISGIPTEQGVSDVTMILMKNSDIETSEPHYIECTFEVTKVDERLLSMENASARLVRDTSSANAFDGLLYFSKNDDDSLTVSVICQESKEPLTSYVYGWTSYDGETGSLVLDTAFDNGATLKLQVGIDPETDKLVGDVLFMASNGSHYTGALMLCTDELPEEYVGIYNIALRDHNDYEGLTEGWMTMTVSDDLSVNGRIHVYDAETEGHFTSCVMADGCIYYYQPLYWDSEARCYRGQVGGILDVTPVSRRSKDVINDTCVSGCGDNSSMLWFNRSEYLVLNPCGTTFLPGYSITECVETDTFYFVSEQPVNTVVPNYVRLSEKKDMKLEVIGETLLGAELGTITVDGWTGTFTGTVNVLKRNTEDVADLTLERVPVNVCGLLVPTTQDCCSVSENIAIAYGAFRYGEGVYRVRVFADSFGRLEAPVVTTKAIQTDMLGDEHIVTCMAAPVEGVSRLMNGLLFSDSTGELFLASWTGTDVELSLDGSKEWTFSSIMVDDRLAALDNQPVSESDVVHVGKVRTITYGVSEDSDVVLKAGWNLIGVPYSLMLPAGTQFSGSGTVLGYNSWLNQYVMPGSIVSGNAYYVYVSANRSLTLKGVETAANSRAVQDIPAGWTLMAYPGSISDAAVWSLRNGEMVNGVPQGADDTVGVWIYR